MLGYGVQIGPLASKGSIAFEKSVWHMLFFTDMQQSKLGRVERWTKISALWSKKGYLLIVQVSRYCPLALHDIVNLMCFRTNECRSFLLRVTKPLPSIRLGRLLVNASESIVSGDSLLRPRRSHGYDLHVLVKATSVNNYNPDTDFLTSVFAHKKKTYFYGEMIIWL